MPHVAEEDRPPVLDRLAAGSDAVFRVEQRGSELYAGCRLFHQLPKDTRILNRQTGATILLASHNMAEVERLGSDVLMMKAGRIVDRGTPQDLIRRYGRQTLEEVFLDIARTRDEIGSLSQDNSHE